MDFLFDANNGKEIRNYEKIIKEILRYKKTLVSLSNEELKNKTLEFKERLNSGEMLDDILIEAFAVAKEASRRYLDKEQRDVQLMGALALHNGDIAEMKTGEGKTLTAPIAAYLNALTGKSVHIATSNDYLSARDAKDIRPMFEGLGLTVGVVTSERLDESAKTSEELEKRIKLDSENRKKAYACDIVYGSSNAFAFDYLRDNTSKTQENVVRGDREVGFIIIDEADQILVNDAVMPFKLSGETKSTTSTSIEEFTRLAKQRKQEEDAKRHDRSASAFVYKLSKDKKRCGLFRNEESLMLHQGGNLEKTRESQSKYNVLYCKGGSSSLTERGWLEAFKYFNDEDIQVCVNENKKLIINDERFELNKDYILDDDKNIELTLTGLEKAVKYVPDIKNLNNAFYSMSEFNGLNLSIENALKAYFTLEKGKDYVLQDSIDNFGLVKKKVLLVSNGRTQEGRVYSGGLQQAIELKETRQNPLLKIDRTKEYDELASISQKAFYSIYPKIAGMTGTSAKDLFDNVYGMQTIEIPKHTEYDVDYSEIEKIYEGRTDKDTVVFDSEEEKLNAVIESVLSSHKKGQPVLIGTLSINESNKLYEAFSRRGIPCQKLNAENAKEEAEIISRAGKKGMITISTQMAGRGTDIKLGGEFVDAIEIEKEKLVNKMAEVLDQNMPLEKRRELALHFIETKKMDIVESTAINRVEKEKQELINVGGLKVIGYGHYQTKRDDDQLRGRAARQDDPGVTEFYVHKEELIKHLGVSKDRVAYLEKLGLSKGNPLSGERVEKVIYAAQSMYEETLTNLISSTQEVDHNLSIMRRKVYDQRARMLKGEDPKENMEFIIKSSISNLIGRNLPENSYFYHKDKVKSSGLNINNFIIDVEETFGIDLTSAFEEGEFKRLGDIERELSVKAIEQYNLTRSKNGDEKQNDIDRENIIATLDNAWGEFNENLDYIKFQNNLNNLVQNSDYDEVLAMKKGFNRCMADSKINMLGKMFGKISSKTRETESLSQELDIEENVNEYEVNERKSYTNLSVRPAKIIATFTDKVKLIKDKIKYQFELVSIDENDEIDKVQNIDFDKGYNSQVSTKK